MVPKKVGEKAVLLCQGCGKEVSTFKRSAYKITTTTQRASRDIPIIEGQDRGEREVDHRYITDLYGGGTYESEE
jgi:hypothetical protein